MKTLFNLFLGKTITFLKQNEDSLILIFLFSFFVSPVLFLVTGINISNFLFVIAGISIVIAFFQKGINPNILKVLLSFLCFLLFGFINGLLHGVPAKNVTFGMLYYLKPTLFFLFSMYFVKPFQLNRLFSLIIIAGIFCLPIFLISPQELIAVSKTRLENLGYDVPETGYFSGTEVTRVIVIPRNPSFILSYLDSAYVYFFITSFFVLSIKSLKNSVKRLPNILAAFVLFLSTFTRSVIIALPVTIIIWLFLRIKNQKTKLMICIGFAAICLILGSVFSKQLSFWLVQQESSMIHWKNIADAIKHIIEYPMGSGLGTSGWQGASSLRMYLYAEGSIFTSIIELGLQFIVWYIFLFWIMFKKSPTMLFPIYLGYLIVAVVLPIGFSTQLNVLFFTALGILYNYDQEYGKKSINLNN